jgi:hypothetical protein
MTVYRVRAMMSALLVCMSTTALADRDACRVTLTAAFTAPTDITFCELARTDKGDVLGYLSGDVLYLAQKDRAGTHLLELKLSTGTMTEKPTNQTIVDKPWPSDSLADAKQFYYPFDVNNRIRDATENAGNGFVCINPKSAHLNVNAVRATICQQRRSQ